MFKKAVVLVRGFFRNRHGKTAHGLIRYGKKFVITGIIDETCAGIDAGELLNMGKIGIPVIDRVPDDAEVLIIGVAPSGGKLPKEWRVDIINAIEKGMDIVSGLHEFLSDDPEFSKSAEKHGVEIKDIRKPSDELLIGSGYKANIPVVLTLGTDACVGKRTAALELVRSAEGKGFNPGFVATGQSGILIGCDAGIVVDSLPADFISGMVEKCIKEVEALDKDIIFVEGQGALSHHAYGSSTHGILYGAQPRGTVIVHTPGRTSRASFPDLPMTNLESEIALIASHTKAPVLGIALNFFEGPRTGEADQLTKQYEDQFKVPVVDVFKDGANRVFEHIEKELL